MPADSLRVVIRALAEQLRGELGPCPPAATIDAYLDHRLAAEEREVLQDHFALCHSCTMLILSEPTASRLS